jgi:formyltetrahydrofolate synthetase
MTRRSEQAERAREALECALDEVCAELPDPQMRVLVATARALKEAGGAEQGPSEAETRCRR